MLTTVLKIAVVFILIATIYLFIFQGKKRVIGKYPLGIFTFTSLLFTAGLDSGLVMLPLTEFPVYEKDPAYAFTNPAAIEFGFWGFLVWTFYFITAYYFLRIEPKIKLFEVPFFKYLNNGVIVATCAFTGFLFLGNLPTYIADISDLQAWLLVSFVVLTAVCTSTEIRFIKVLAVGSTWLFFSLIFGMWLDSGMGGAGFLKNLGLVGDYFPNIGHFVLPINDYHEFYLMWWFSWSIMIGQFMAKFAGNMSTRTLLLGMLVIPSIQLAVWFSVLYGYYSSATEVALFWKTFMVVVGIIYVVNSLDSLTRLYTDNLNLTTKRLGTYKYIILNFSVMMGLVGLYKFAPEIMDIKYVGMTVILMYVAALVRMYMKRDVLMAPTSGDVNAPLPVAEN